MSNRCVCVIDASRRRRAGGIDVPRRRHRRGAALLDRTINIGDPIITRTSGGDLSTFDSTGARRRRRQIDVFARGHGARVHGARSGVGPHDDGHRRRRGPARRPARPRTGGRRRGRLLRSRPAFLPPHVALAPARAAAVAFRRRELAREAPQVPKPLAALAPLEVAARRRVDPGRLVALSTNVLVLFWYYRAAAPDRRHGRWRRRGYWFLARYGLLRRSLSRHHDRDGRVALARWRRSRHRRRPPGIGRGLPPAHDAVPRAPCLGSRVIHQRIVRGSFASQDAIQRWNIAHLYCRRNGTSHR